MLFQRFWETYPTEVRQPFAEAWDAARPAETLRGIANRASSHSRAQIRIFASRDLRPAWFTDADIAAHLEREYRPWHP